MMKYPGRLIKKGEKDKKIVKAVQKKLNEIKCYPNELPIEVDGDFGNQTVAAVKVFQSRNTDATGNVLVIDGTLGPISWQTLFGIATVPQAVEPPNDGLASVLAIANAEVGVQEVPLNSNMGPRVEEFLASVNLGGGYAWCAAFVYWCFNKAAAAKNKPNPLVCTGGVLKSWNLSAGKKITAAEAINNPKLLKPGQIFIMSYGGGLGHTGIIESVNGGFINTIEGNTNNQSSREGSGVYKRTRKINSINKGFIEYKL
jgi:peptidoglycan hydrolase-like protein with peptidoglycan-binding domain